HPPSPVSPTPARRIHPGTPPCCDPAAPSPHPEFPVTSSSSAQTLIAARSSSHPTGAPAAPQMTPSYIPSVANSDTPATAARRASPPSVPSRQSETQSMSFPLAMPPPESPPVRSVKFRNRTPAAHPILLGLAVASQSLPRGPGRLST